MEKRTKIVCTIGPASQEVEQLVALAEAGMNVCRLNFSHGTHEEHAELIKRIRHVRELTGEPLTILQDLQGPKIRVGVLPDDGVKLEAGKTIIFTSGKGNIPKSIPVTYPNLHEDVKAGQHLLLDDGLLEVMVKGVKGDEVTCQIITGGILKSHKGLNLPETKTSIPSITDKDKDDLAFGIRQGVDWVALSFVRSADDIRQLRGLIGNAPIKVIAKMEKPEAVTNMDEIVAAVDGIMVARGDLGIELPAERVPIIQKDLITKCLAARKPVIVATQMLDSMIRNPRATRAEVSDIENAVIDHTDATMLSGETASGEHPLEAVKTMAASIVEAEKSAYDDIRIDATENNLTAMLARASEARAILVASMTGATAEIVSHYRRELPIYVAVPSEKLAPQLNLIWGTHPFAVEGDSLPKIVERGMAELLRRKAVTTGDDVIVVAGEPVGPDGHIDLVEMRKA
ncbi:MAG TPA: pyruvate kinase [Verrucomicrobiae bacterium]|nr:pyruvate kinase [Verrucomicrobiae bacterium]